MKYVIALAVPPLYFLLERKWLATFGNGALYLLAWFTVWFMGIGVLFWLFAAAHAMWHLRKTRQSEMIQEHAEAIGREIREGS